MSLLNLAPHSDVNCIICAVNGVVACDNYL